jgi:ribonuclease HII
MATEAPTLDYERRFLSRGVQLLAGVDEVGRGALAGPVTVGITVVDLGRQELLEDVRDSKLLKAEDRERLEPIVRGWSVASAVGHASANEIDSLGIIAALRTAGNRAWNQILALGITPQAVLLDGSHNWLTPDPQPSLFDEPGLFDEPSLSGEPSLMVAAMPEPGCDAPVYTLVKADMQCLSVAAASVLAKVERDRLMLSLHTEYPAFGWNENKGYGTAAHREAIRLSGPTPYHRVSWQLFGTDV